MMSHRILPAALLLCTLAACGQSPTGSDSPARPAGPAYEEAGGYGMGSGNSVAQSGGGFTIGSETEDTGGFGIGSGGLTADTEDEPPAEATEERAGGYGMGSGN